MDETKTVLWVEDDKKLLDNWVPILRRQGFNVIGCRNPIEAIAIFVEIKPELVILDLQFENDFIDGREVFRIIRNLNEKIPIVACTAFINDARYRDIAKMADYVMEKPLFIMRENESSFANMINLFNRLIETYKSYGQGQKTEDKNSITISKSKLELELRDAVERLKAKNRFYTPLGLLLTIIACLVTSNFKDFLGLRSEFWLSLFLLFGLVILFRLIINIYSWFKYQNITMRSIIEIIIQNSRPYD